MPALIDWAETLRDVWSGFILEVVLDPEGKNERSAQVELLRQAVVTAQGGYVIQKIVIPTEPGIDPADFSPAGWDGILNRFENGDFDTIMLLGDGPGGPADFFIVSLLWEEYGMFRIETSLDYLKALENSPSTIEALVDTARLAWARCHGTSGWANVAVAGEPEQAEEVARLAGKWRRKSAVTLLDLTPPGRDPQPIEPRVHGACWLTMLSADAVTALGGLEAVDSALPEDIRLELFEDGGMLVQLTPSPVVPEAPDVEEKYKALSGLVDPVRGG